MAQPSANDLVDRSCTPCRGGVAPMTKVEATTFMKQVPQWSLSEDGTRIERKYSFADYKAAFGFVARVSEVAEDEGHHPDIAFGWGYAVITLQTHKIKGLHENDFIMAAKIDDIARSVT